MQFRLRTLLIVLALGPALLADFYFSAKWWMVWQSKPQLTLKDAFKGMEPIRTSNPKHGSSSTPIPSQTVSPLP